MRGQFEGLNSLIERGLNGFDVFARIENIHKITLSLKPDLKLMRFFTIIYRAISE